MQRCRAILVARPHHVANSEMSAEGQTRKIRARLLKVRFTPLSGRMLRRVSMTACGDAVLRAKGIRDATAPQHAGYRQDCGPHLRTMQARL
jgi:hypothetical protein